MKEIAWKSALSRKPFYLNKIVEYFFQLFIQKIKEIKFTENQFQWSTYKTYLHS